MAGKTSSLRDEIESMSNTMTKCDYVIVTPAFNEAQYLKDTIESVVAQTVLPLAWVIVDDDSTDATPDIIQSYARTYPWILYVHRERQPGQTYYASNVCAINEGKRRISDKAYEFLAILDADIKLPRHYYDTLLGYMKKDQKLGVASGIYENLIDGKLHSVLSDRRSTPKAIQVFRSQAFEQIRGYLPLPYGGEDTCACVMARMKGWKTWSFPDLKAVHLRPTGLGNTGSVLKAKYIQGIHEYSLGNHPVFVLGKCVKRSIYERPYFIGGFARLLGFLGAHVKRLPHDVPLEVRQYHWHEQWHRILRRNRISALQRPHL
jgi:biofilm PGA synthesis N-glycosyltransferase PgaC